MFTSSNELGIHLTLRHKKELKLTHNSLIGKDVSFVHCLVINLRRKYQILLLCKNKNKKRFKVNFNQCTPLQ